jgi:cyclopropane fatty-acyl-phospholipid synthase-like methyltransferase
MLDETMTYSCAYFDGPATSLHQAQLAKLDLICRKQIERVRSLGYDRRFQRSWELYLAYCEGGFGGGRIADAQLLLAKPRYQGSIADPTP